MRLSTLRITLFTLVLGLGSLWVIHQKEQSTLSNTSTNKTPEPYHWSAIQNTTWEFSRDQPEKQNAIQTASWYYNKSTKLSQFTQPLIILTTPKTITIIRSQKGKTLNDETIQLSDNVHITQHPTSNGNIHPSTLSTQNLTYNANQAELLSRDTITLTQARSVTTGVGLYANLEFGQFQLMSNVQSTYQLMPPNPP